MRIAPGVRRARGYSSVWDWQYIQPRSWDHGRDLADERYIAPKRRVQRSSILTCSLAARTDHGHRRGRG
jgi:hypothetical protein